MAARSAYGPEYYQAILAQPEHETSTRSGRSELSGILNFRKVYTFSLSNSNTQAKVISAESGLGSEKSSPNVRTSLVTPGL